MENVKELEQKVRALKASQVIKKNAIKVIMAREFKEDLPFYNVVMEYIRTFELGDAVELIIMKRPDLASELTAIITTRYE